MMRDKIIKQNIILISVFVLIVLVFGVASIIIEKSGVVHSEAEMLQGIKEDQEISGELTVIDTFYAESESDDNRLPSYDKLLLLCMEEDSYRDSFIAAQFDIVGENEYKFDRYEKLTEGEPEIYFGTWDNKYIVVCNNEDAVRYEAILDGAAQEENIGSIPCVLTFEYEYSGSVDFYDANGNKMS